MPSPKPSSNPAARGGTPTASSGGVRRHRRGIQQLRADPVSFVPLCAVISGLPPVPRLDSPQAFNQSLEGARNGRRHQPRDRHRQADKGP
jgi:hypothetical protein